MTLRALVVFLAALNLGVGAWWLFRPDVAPVAIEAAPSGIARLQLVSERPDARPAPAPVADAATPVSAPATTAAATEPPAAPERCFRFGPFADLDTLAAAQTALRPRALRLFARETQEGSARGWRVYLPAASDRDAANAAAEKLKVAGFNDLLIVANGAEANSIALGRFSTEARAQQHAQALRTAGFEAKAEPLGEVRTTRWIDLAAAAGFDIAAARRASGAAQSRAIDCAGVK